MCAATHDAVVEDGAAAGERSPPPPPPPRLKIARALLTVSCSQHARDFRSVALISLYVPNRVTQSVLLHPMRNNIGSSVQRLADVARGLGLPIEAQLVLVIFAVISRAFEIQAVFGCIRLASDDFRLEQIERVLQAVQRVLAS